MSIDNSDFDYINQFSPEGLLKQVEFATNATHNSGTAIGMTGNDGVVFAVGKTTSDPLLQATENRRTFTVDQHVGAVAAGLIPDARNIVDVARIKANDHRKSYGEPVPLSVMVPQIGSYMHEYTLQSDRRPFGASLVVGSYIPDGPKLYCIEPSGEYQSYSGWAIGKSADAAISEIEKIDFENIPVMELINEAARIIYKMHEDEAALVLELSWCSKSTGGEHELVPPHVLKEAEGYAKENGGVISD